MTYGQNESYETHTFEEITVDGVTYQSVDVEYSITKYKDTVEDVYVESISFDGNVVFRKNMTLEEISFFEDFFYKYLL